LNSPSQDQRLAGAGEPRSPGPGHDLGSVSLPPCGHPSGRYAT
jgi:hypothetical protein